MKNKYVVAVSGGVDSMYLATKLAMNNQAAAFVHINHHTRSTENDFEQELVKKLGEEYNLPVYIFDYHHKAGNFQAAARDFRYQKLSLVARKYYKKIATAHHLDDQLENCLMATHLVKSNLIEYRAKLGDCYIYRPLLGMRKTDIYSKAKMMKIEYNEDVSNQSLDYNRNKLRHSLREDEEFHAASINYILETSKQMYKQKIQITELNRTFVSDKTDTYRYFLLYRLIKSCDSKIMVKNRQLESINKLLKQNKNSKYSITNCKVLFIGYDKIYMLASDEQIMTRAVLKLGRNEFNGFLFDSNLSEGGIRTWQPGDRVKIKNGHKKVARIFIDNKIDVPLRAKWPIIVDNMGTIIEIPKLWRKQ